MKIQCRAALLIALTLLACLAGSAFGQSLPVTAVGVTSGQFGVSANGQATYTIPIWTPPGARDVQPSLSLTYNSAGGSGLIGPGWSLAGFSQIFRCQKTYEQDGAAGPVLLSMADTFCIDGKRLRVTSGLATYGQANSTYQTEIADFSLTTARDSAGNGPAWFEVKAKNGLIYEYGNSTDSRAMLPGTTTPYAWALNKVRDRQGNNMAITYVQSSGTLIPANIQYTQLPSISSAYPYTVGLSYASRDSNDQITGYIAGAPFSLGSQLTAIEVRAGTTLLRMYRLGYTDSPTTQRSRLSSIQECAGAAGTDCKSATTIAYQNGQAGIQPPATAAGTIAAPTDGGQLHHVDINGDARTDLIYEQISGATRRWWLRLADASGFAAAVDTGIELGIDDDAMIDDFIGSGRPCILAPSSGIWHMYCWNGSAFSVTSTQLAVDANKLPSNSPADGRFPAFASADVNGDGLADLVWAAAYASVNSVYTRLNTSSGGVPAFSGTKTLAFPVSGNFGGVYGNHSNVGKSIRKVDFNGDGRDDVLLGSWNSTQFGISFSARELISQGTTFATGPSFTGGYNVLNWNNDTCTDVAHGYQIHVAACNGATGQQVQLSVAGMYVDWDGDGRTDALGTTGSGFLSVQLSQGTSAGPPTATNITGGTLIALDQNGDGLQDLLSWSSSGAIAYGLHNGANTPPDFVSSIVDGFGNSFSPVYKSISQSNYTDTYPGVPPLSFPNIRYYGPMYVVSDFTASDGTGGTFTTQFHYWDARKNLHGRGFLGFAARRTIDSRNSLQRVERFNQAFPLTGTVKQEDVYQPDGVTVVTRTKNTLLLSGLNASPYQERSFISYSGILSEIHQIGGPLNGLEVMSKLVMKRYDGWGSLYDEVISYSESNGGLNFHSYQIQQTLLTNFVNDTVNWCFQPSQVQQISTRALPGGDERTQTTGYAWDYVNCRPTQSVVEPGSTQWQISTSYGYDAAGNLNGITNTPAPNQGQSARTTSISWGPSGRFPTQITDAKLQTTILGWDLATGTRTSVTDPNNLTVSWQYDTFNRVIREQQPDGSAVNYAFSACNSANSFCGNGSNDLRVGLQVTLRDTANAVIRTDAQYFDGLGRIRHAHEQLLSGSTSIVTTQYDTLGRVQARSTPHTFGNPIWYTNYQYDWLQRPTLIERPTSESDVSMHTMRIKYEGLSVVVTDAQNRTTTTWLDFLGQPIKITDPTNSHTEYVYDSVGNLLVVKDTLNNENRMTYNVRGMKMTSSDPDMGNWSYDYYPLGELKSQTDAKGQTTTYTYDELSRPLTRVEAEGTTSWVWGASAAAHNIGQLQSISAFGYSESFSYDSLGRLATRNIVSDDTYNYDFTYDALTGALKTLEYPTSTPSYRLKLQYGYQNGLLQQIKDANGSTVFWQADNVNALGQVTQETLGNNVVTTRSIDRLTGLLNSIQSGVGGGAALQNESYLFDKAGNLTQRQNNEFGLTEDFYYDALDRLDYSKLNGVINLDLAYNAIGNITSRSDVASGATWSYHATKKHAVVQAGSNTYSYDANGNAQTRNGHSLSWTSYNYPSVINGPGKTMTFSYGPDRQRYRQVYTNGSTTETTIYVGGLLEKVTESGITDWRHSVFAGDSAVAIVSRKSNGTNATRYMLHDHQGSVAKILDASGGSFVGESFAAFGARRDTNTWSGPCPCPDLQNIKSVTRSGYTGHEMIGGQSMGLIHMNGRVYDSTIGRFLSPDPYVQAPFFSQSLNRYSYVFNNPLSYTDPNGFWGIILRFDFGGAHGSSGTGNGGSIADGSGYTGGGGYGVSDRGLGRGGGGSSGGGGRPPISTPPPIPDEPTPTPTPPPTPEPIPGPTPQPLPPGPEGIGGLGSTVGGTQILDTITAPWGGWDDFKYSVRCTWECDMPGNGSLEANLAALPFLPIGIEGAAAGSLTAIRATYLRSVDDLVGLGQSMRAAGTSAEQAARLLVPLRNQLKLDLRAQGSWFAARTADVRNLVRYGNRAGPTADDLYRQYGSWDKVLDALGRTNTTVDTVLGVGR